MRNYADGISEGVNMKINLDDFRVRAGEKVKLKKWPTRIKPCYKSKEHYQEMLGEHRKELKARRKELLHLIAQAVEKRAKAKKKNKGKKKVKATATPAMANPRA